MQHKDNNMNPQQAFHLDLVRTIYLLLAIYGVLQRKMIVL